NQRHIRLEFPELGNGFDAIGSFSHYFDSIHYVQQRHQSLAHHVMVFHHENANGFLCGHDSPVLSLASLGVITCRRTVVPIPSSLVTSSVPPIASARSRIPVRP